MNKVILIGNVSRDPEVRTTQSGVKYASFGLAVNRRFANNQGVHEADFFNVVAWRATADFVEKYVEKGKKVGVVGSLQTRTYDAQDGSKRTVTEIVVDELEFLGAKGEKKAGDAQKEAAEEKPKTMVEANDDELPF